MALDTALLALLALLARLAQPLTRRLKSRRVIGGKRSSIWMVQTSAYRSRLNVEMLPSQIQMHRRRFYSWRTPLPASIQHPSSIHRIIHPDACKLIHAPVHPWHSPNFTSTPPSTPLVLFVFCCAVVCPSNQSNESIARAAHTNIACCPPSGTFSYNCLEPALSCVNLVRTLHTTSLQPTTRCTLSTTHSAPLPAG